jgi:hypothetical protein
MFREAEGALLSVMFVRRQPGLGSEANQHTVLHQQQEQQREPEQLQKANFRFSTGNIA